MQFFRNQPIRRQIVGATLLMLLALVAAGTWAARRTLQERETELRQQAVSLATLSVAYLDQYFATLDSAAAVLTRHPAVQRLDAAECSALFAELLRGEPQLANVLLTAASGVPTASALPIPPGMTRAPGWQYVSRVIDTRRPVVSPLFNGTITHKPVVVFAYPVIVRDVPVAALGFAVDLTKLQQVFARVPLPDSSVVTITDRRGLVLVRSVDAERYIGRSMGANSLEPSKVPVADRRLGLDNVERFYGNTVVERGPWVLSVGIPTTVAASSRLGQLRRTTVIGLTSLAIGLVVVLWAGHGLSRQLARLRSAAQRIASGDLTPPDPLPAPNREVADLQEAFVTMAQRLNDAREALDRRVEEERRMRERLASLQRQVVRQERLAAVGVLVSGVAHELNNPLQAILGATELIERTYNLPADVLDEIAFVRTQSGRARDIIRNLSRFSAQQSGPPTLVDLRDVIGEVVKLRRRELESASISLDIEVSTLRPVFANFTELEQVVLNFVINAQQAIVDGRRPHGRILVRLTDAGRRVRLEVLDDGPGVKAEDEPKLFQPFFTTKPVGQGTGLGLSVSYGIVDSFGGTIGHLRNEWGGATFFFELPGPEAASAKLSVT